MWGFHGSLVGRKKVLLSDTEVVNSVTLVFISAESVFGTPDTWFISDMMIPKHMNESDISNPFNWGSRTRTYDIAVNSRPFYQLNYTPMVWMMGICHTHNRKVTLTYVFRYLDSSWSEVLYLWFLNDTAGTTPNLLHYPVSNHKDYSVTSIENPSILKSGIADSNRWHLTWKDSVLPLN